VRRPRPRWRTTIGPAVSLAAAIGSFAGCWRADLPSIVSGNGKGNDAGAAAVPPPAQTDAGRIILAAEVDGGTPDAGTNVGRIALTVSLPIDASSGEVLSIGSLHLRLLPSDGTPATAFWLQLDRPPPTVTVNLDNIASSTSYTLEITSATTGGPACAASSPVFAVPTGATVRVFSALICDTDAGLVSAIGDPTATP
jgi:hypothetical protein